MEPSDAKDVRALDAENIKLKKLLVEQRLNNFMLQDVTKKVIAPDAKRKPALHLMDIYRMSPPRASSALTVYRALKEA